MARYFTEAGFTRLREIIKQKELTQRKIGVQVGEAAGVNCDWHDNAPYEDARARLELASSDVQRLRAEIAGAVVVTIDEQNARVAIGTTIIVIDEDSNEKTYTIGAANESLPRQGLISYDSPIASSLIGKQVGDVVPIMLRGVEVEFEIKAILPPSARYSTLVAKFYESTETPT